ncbi:hypothetical protein IKF63_02775 [Candidatus Saccharibacteria bacterium]|nr:hypothetical protein [Candidatus Saccharibacteria bacterium]
MVKISDSSVSIIAPRNCKLICYSTSKDDSIDTFFQSVITPFVPEGPNSDQLNEHFKRLLEGKSTTCDLKEIQLYNNKFEIIQSCHRGGTSPRCYSNTTTYRDNNDDFTLGIDIVDTNNGLDETERYVILFTPTLLNIAVIMSEATKTICVNLDAAAS